MPSPRVHPILLAVLLLGIVTLGIQGLRMARERQSRLVPERARLATAGAGESLVLEAGEHRYLAVDLARTAPELLGLFQRFPERDVLRWVERPESSGESLVIPLDGLAPGHYRLVQLPPGTEAGPREMDRPADSQFLLLEFELR